MKLKQQHDKSYGTSGVVTPHKNCHRHHDESISIHGVLPLWVLADIRQLFLFRRLVLILDLGAPPTA